MPASYRNPVIPGFYPDPSVCRVGEDFYLVTSSFEYFPGIPVFHSTDLVSWTPLGHCLTRSSQLDLLNAPASGGVFAPTIRWHDGRFFVAGTNVSGGGHFIVNATDPAGPWSDPVWVDQDGIDPSLFFEDDLCYFTSNIEPDPGAGHEARPSFRRGVQQSLVDPLTGRRTSDVRFLWEGSGGRFPEAPHLFRRGDLYYLLLAEGGTESGHMATLARSTSPWGPWEPCPRNPVLSARSTASPLQNTGHADLVELADGTWWAVCLGVRPVGNHHHLGRETLLAPVRWDEDGWPVIGEDGVVPEEYPRPALAPAVPQVEPTTDVFDDPALPPRWNTLRRPLRSTEMSFGAGGLTLVGGPATTDDPLLVFVGRRQQHLLFMATADLEADLGPEDEVGLTIRMNERHHVDLAVRSRDGRRHVALRQRIGPASADLGQVAVTTGPLRLTVDGDPVGYACSVTDRTGEQVVGRAEAKYLSTEVAGGFTGVYLGMYASSSGERPAAAVWSSFEYRPTEVP